MNDKILINVYFIKLDQGYDIYVPAYENIGQIVELVSKTITNLSDGDFNYNDGYAIIDSVTGELYDLNQIISDTKIRNGHKLLVF